MSLLADLARALPGLPVSASAVDRVSYARDLWPRHHLAVSAGRDFEHRPAAIAWPRSTEEVASLVRYCRAEGVPLVPFGAGSGVCGGILPEARAVVCDLKRMRRTYDSERFLDLVGRLREAMPDISLTTDVIVGFPGETEDDFLETMRVYDEASFDHAYTFIYSPRNGTEAAGFDDQISDDVKHERLARLVELVQRHAARRNAELIGTVQEVLSEGPSRTDPTVFRGKTRGNKTTLFTPAAPAGTTVSVLIEESTSQTLRGRVTSAVLA